MTSPTITSTNSMVVEVGVRKERRRVAPSSRQPELQSEVSVRGVRAAGSQASSSAFPCLLSGSPGGPLRESECQSKGRARPAAAQCSRASQPMAEKKAGASFPGRAGEKRNSTGASAQVFFL